MPRMKNLCACAMCIALCCILPAVLHPFGQKLASALSPMHFPVILCGLAFGWSYGGVCGALGPLAALLITGRPVPPRLFYMMAELVAYGVLTGVLMKRIRTGRTLLDIYLSMIPAMLLGRLVGGLVEALLLGGGFFSFFIGSYFVGTAPGIVLQLVLIPMIYLALMNAKLIPRRYSKVMSQ